MTAVERDINNLIIRENKGISCFPNGVSIDTAFDRDARDVPATPTPDGMPRVFGGYSRLVFEIDGEQFPFVTHDYGMWFKSFLPSSLSEDEIRSVEAQEGSRCFFLCIARKLSLNPFLLQSALRQVAEPLSVALYDPFRVDAIETLQNRNELIDFCCLSHLWVTELDSFQFSLITLSRTGQYSLTIINEGAANHCVLFLSRNHFELVSVEGEDTLSSFITRLRNTIRTGYEARPQRNGDVIVLAKPAGPIQSIRYWLKEVSKKVDQQEEESGRREQTGGGAEGVGGGGVGGGGGGGVVEGEGEGPSLCVCVCARVYVCVCVCVGVHV
jgi:hypothetical protein